MFRPANRSSSGHQSNKAKVLLRYWDPNIYNYIQYKIWYWIKYIVKLKPLKHESALDIRTVLSSFSYLMDCGWTHVAYILQNKCLFCWRIPVTLLYTSSEHFVILSLLLFFEYSVPWLNNPHIPSKQCLEPYAWSFLCCLVLMKYYLGKNISHMLQLHSPHAYNSPPSCRILATTKNIGFDSRYLFYRFFLHCSALNHLKFNLVLIMVNFSSCTRYTFRRNVKLNTRIKILPRLSTCGYLSRALLFTA